MKEELKKIKIWDRDNIFLLMTFVYTSGLIYFSNPSIARLGFLFLLLPAFQSKKNYIWLALIFLLYDTPNYFYYGGDATDPTRVPLYSLGRGMSLGFQELLMIVLFLKTISIRSVPMKKVKKEFAWLAGLFVIYFFISFLIGIKLSNVILTIRYIIPLAFIFVMPKLFRSKEDWFHFFKVLFPFVIFTFVGEIYFILTKNPLVSIISPQMTDKLNRNLVAYTVGGGPSRFITGVSFGFTCFVAALYFLTKHKDRFNNAYLLFIAILVMLQAILSATRSYSIAYLVIFAGFLLIQRIRQLPQIILLSTLILLSLFQLTSKSDLLKTQVDASYKRLITVRSLLSGADPDAAASDSRLSGKTPRVLNKFAESPVLGFAFSDEYYENADDHVAIPNLLLNLGVVGFLIFHGIFISLIIKTSGVKKGGKISPETKLFFLGLFGILLVHLMGRQIFGFTLPPYIHFFVVVYFTFWLFINYSPEKRNMASGH